MSEKVFTDGCELSGNEAAPASVDPVWSILPSYYMYSNTINTGINDTVADPPKYKVPGSLNSNSSTVSDGALTASHISSFGDVTAVSSHSTSNSRSSMEYEEFDSRIKDNILDNMHKLKNLTLSSNKSANAIDISLVFTKDTGVASVPPTIIDPTNSEFRQGDYVNGYVLIKNNGPVTINFDTFYVVLEGEFRVEENMNSMHPSVTLKTFLQMVDFNASYNDVEINRLVSCEGSSCNTIAIDNYIYSYDPFDKSVMCLGNRKLLPNILYKKFFTFKIPGKLLDSPSYDNGLSAHVALPPSFGDCRTLARDFSTITSSVKYGVSARIIGKHSKYNPKVTSASEFVILKGTEMSFRVVPYTSSAPDFRQAKAEYDEFFRSLNEQLTNGSKLLFPEKFTKEQSENTDTVAKIEKWNIQQKSKVEQIPAYDFYIPLYKKHSFLKISLSNFLQVKTPKQRYSIAYIAPEKYRGAQETDASSWKLDVPFEVSINGGNKDKSVDIRSITSELVVLTLESEKYAFPMELHHDVLFNKFKSAGRPEDLLVDSDSLENNLISHLKELYLKMESQLKRATATGVDWKIEKKLAFGIKALAKMRVKAINLEIPDSRVSVDIKNIQWSTQADGKLVKRFNLEMDLASAKLKSTSRNDCRKTPAYSRFTLVPNFQSCHLCRMYYVKVILGLSNGQNAYVKLPVKVENIAR